MALKPSASGPSPAHPAVLEPMAAPSSASARRRDPPEQGSAPSSASAPYSKTVAKEIRRSRGEIACAECRRLKVRCNRQIPCSTCISRGCVALCPNGILPPGDNSRFVSAAKDHLHKKLSKLEERMRALEDALAIAQSAECAEPHPLLRQAFRSDEPLDDDDGDEASDERDSGEEALADSFGTLHINPTEKTIRFYGPSGGVESMLDDDLPPASPIESDDYSINLRALGFPVEIDPFYNSFPLAPVGLPVAAARSIAESFLPRRDRAVSLCRLMLEHMSWMFQIVSFQQFTQELLPNIYVAEQSATISLCGAHDLALFFCVLAIGALMDLSLPAYNSQAQRYYVLARVSLALQPMTRDASLSTVKALHLISIYNGMSGRESNMSNTYTVLNLAGRLAQKIGLHIDPSHWKLSAKDAYDRRTYFWNLVSGDLWQSLGTGRPPGLANAFGLCKIPTESEERQYQKGELAAVGFGVWGFHASEHLLIPVMQIVMSTKPPSYREVLDLDKTIRSFKMPSISETMDSPSTAVSMMCFVRSNYMELILLALHRAFFAQAMAMNPQNPLEGPYGHSFITAYKCACIVIETTSYAYKRNQPILSRIWMIWSFCFTSAIIVGAVASRCKDLNIDPPPLAVLHQACVLFEVASKTNSRAAKALPVLLNLHERAVHLHGATTKMEGAPPGQELEILFGRPRLTVVAPTTARVQTAPPSANTVRPPVLLPHPTYMTHRTTTSAPALPTHDPRVFRSEWHPDPRRDLYTLPPNYPTVPSSAPPQLPQHAHPQQQAHLEHYAASLPEQIWEFSPHQDTFAYHPEGQAVDFNLGDAWQAFMQNYTGL